jgi:hypothetical protein
MMLCAGGARGRVCPKLGGQLPGSAGLSFAAGVRGHLSSKRKDRVYGGSPLGEVAVTGMINDLPAGMTALGIGSIVVVAAMENESAAR